MSSEALFNVGPWLMLVLSTASASNILLPLTVANKWTAEVLICGGTPPEVDLDGNPAKLSSYAPVSSQCIRMVMNAAGFKRGWAVEQMPEPRIMGDGILTPDGKVLLINGAATGIAGYGQSSLENFYSFADLLSCRKCPRYRWSEQCPQSDFAPNLIRSHCQGWQALLHQFPEQFD